MSVGIASIYGASSVRMTEKVRYGQTGPHQEQELPPLEVFGMRTNESECEQTLGAIRVQLRPLACASIVQRLTPIAPGSVPVMHKLWGCQHETTVGIVQSRHA